MSLREVEPTTSLGRRIRQLRKERGLTQEALARRAGMTRQTLASAERGDYDPYYSTLCAIARGLEVALIELFPDEPTSGRRKLAKLGRG